MVFTENGRTLEFEAHFKSVQVKQRVFVCLFIQNLQTWQDSFVTSLNFLPPSHANIQPQRMNSWQENGDRSFS